VVIRPENCPFISSFVQPPTDPEMTESFTRSVCFSPDSKYLVAAGEDKSVKVYDIEKKTLRHNIAGHDLDIYSLDYSKDGRFIVSGSGDKKVKIWDVESGKVPLENFKSRGLGHFYLISPHSIWPLGSVFIRSGQMK